MNWTTYSRLFRSDIYQAWDDKGRLLASVEYNKHQRVWTVNWTYHGRDNLDNKHESFQFQSAQSARNYTTDLFNQQQNKENTINGI